MLSRYIAGIRGEDFLGRLNRMLQSRAASSASNVGGTAADIESYYASRPELRSYTLGVELDRDLDYTLILEDGHAITDKEAIRSHFGHGAGKNNSKEDNQMVDTEELLVRAANQSLLADALVALTGSEEVLEPAVMQQQNSNNDERTQQPRLILSGPVLSMTSVVERCHFTIDLQRGRVEGICVLAISVPDVNRRLVLARAIMTASFRPGARRRQLQYVMQMIKAHHYHDSLAIRNAAISLAKDQENLLFQSGHHGNGTACSGNDDEPERKLFSLFRR